VLRKNKLNIVALSMGISSGAALGDGAENCENLIHRAFQSHLHVDLGDSSVFVPIHQ
jgi:hypothetical protein